MGAFSTDLLWKITEGLISTIQLFRSQSPPHYINFRCLLDRILTELECTVSDLQ